MLAFQPVKSTDNCEADLGLFIRDMKRGADLGAVQRLLVAVQGPGNGSDDVLFRSNPFQFTQIASHPCGLGTVQSFRIPKATTIGRRDVCYYPEKS